MQPEPTTKTEDFKNTLKEKFEPVSQGTCDVCGNVSDSIRRNPIASVVGAAVFGAAVCYLILEGRHQATFGEKYISGPLADAGDSVGTSVRSAFDNLKFW